jgi:hypothetical protein
MMMLVNDVEWNQMGIVVEFVVDWWAEIAK